MNGSDWLDSTRLSRGCQVVALAASARGSHTNPARWRLSSGGGQKVGSTIPLVGIEVSRCRRCQKRFSISILALTGRDFHCVSQFTQLFNAQTQHTISGQPTTCWPTGWAGLANRADGQASCQLLLSRSATCELPKVQPANFHGFSVSTSHVHERNLTANGDFSLSLTLTLTCPSVHCGTDGQLTLLDKD